MTEFGNDKACDNCGDEWAPLDDKGLCPDCRAVWEEQDPSQRSYSWQEMAELTHETQVKTFGWCACEDSEPPYDDCPKPS